MSRLKWLLLILKRHYRSMGLRVVLYALLAVAVAAVGPVAAPWVNGLLDAEMAFSSVLPVLTILASSMLAVSTFSLNVMVSAHHAAAASTTPRVHRLLLEDTTTQSVLAAFIGAFVYSFGAIILYRAGFYAEEAALLVMGITIVVVVVVVVSLLRWISHLSTLGTVDESLSLVRARARESLLVLARAPGFGARPLTPDTVLPVETRPLAAPASGYVQLIDIARMEACLPDTGTVHVLVQPGDHVLEGRTVAEISGAVGDDIRATLAEAFTIGAHRTHEQDARFGLLILAETASRALSPGINDPGTAIRAIHVLEDLLWTFVRTEPDTDRPTATRVFARVPDAGDLAHTAFAPIARDGAGQVEVGLTLRGALGTLAQAGDERLAEAARDLADSALAHSEAAGLLDRDLSDLRALPV